METLRILAEEADAAEEAAAEGAADRGFGYPEHVNHAVERTVGYLLAREDSYIPNLAPEIRSIPFESVYG